MLGVWIPMNQEEIEDMMNAVREGRIFTMRKLIDAQEPGIYESADYNGKRKIAHKYNKKLTYLKKHEYVKQIGMDPIRKTAFWIVIR